MSTPTHGAGRAGDQGAGKPAGPAAPPGRPLTPAYGKPLPADLESGADGMATQPPGRRSRRPPTTGRQAQPRPPYPDRAGQAQAGSRQAQPASRPGWPPPGAGRQPGPGFPAPPRAFPPAAPPPGGESDASLLRSSTGMALGTLTSRITGFLRTLILAYAIGSAELGNAYNQANTLPNVVYDLMLGGILTSVVVPLLVTASRRDADRGEGYFQRIFSLGVIVLGAISLMATLAAALIVDLYTGRVQPAEHHVMVVFAYFFIPQIFFYGVSSLAGAILNARGRFAAPMWTPVINNVVVILILLAYVSMAGVGRNPVTVTPGQVRLLGVGTTLGIVAQTAALIPALLRTGFRPRPVLGFRRAEVKEIGRMAGWLAGYVVTTQVTFFATVRVASAASRHVTYAGFAAYTYAYQLFQMPYAIVGISVITALLPRMAAHASARRYSRVRADFSTGIRLSAAIVVPAALLLAVLAQPLAEMLFGHGSTPLNDANYIGAVFSVFSLGLVPFMTFQLLLRVFYSLHDSRTPCLIGLATMATNVAINVTALKVLPPARVVEALAFGYDVAYLVGAAAAWRLLLRRVGSLDGRAITRSLVKMHVATIPAVIFAIEMIFTVRVLVHPGAIFGLITVVLGGCGGLLLYVMFARWLRVSELSSLVTMIGARFGTGQPPAGNGGPAAPLR